MKPGPSQSEALSHGSGGWALRGIGTECRKFFKGVGGGVGTYFQEIGVVDGCLNGAVMLKIVREDKGRGGGAVEASLQRENRRSMEQVSWRGMLTPVAASEKRKCR